MKEELTIKDVMVGDWVDVRNNAAPNTPHLERITPSHFLRDEYWYGVELVPEILEKNGFEYNDENAKYHPNCWSNGGILLRKRTLTGFFYMVTSDYDDQDTNCTPIIITYVHELQHLLKLCGIEKAIEI